MGTEEAGEVVGAEGGFVTVRMKRTEACARCRACNAGAGAEEMLLRAENACGAEPGDYVEVELGGGLFGKAVLIMYGIPLAALLTGLFGGYAGAGALGLGAYAEWAGLAAGVLLIASAYFIISRNEGRFERGGYTPAAVRVIFSPGVEDERE